MAASTRGITKSLLPAPKTRAAMAKRLATDTGSSVVDRASHPSVPYSA